MTTLVRPDVAFVLSALRRDAGASRAQHDAAARVDDWTAVARFAVAHDLAWWVSRALPRDGVPDAGRAEITDAMRVAALAALSGTRQLLELLQILRGAGVRAVAYKGPALALEVHGDLGARRFTDLDILVCEDDRERARAALAAAGYASPSGYTASEERFFSRWEGVAQLSCDGKLPVELHWRCQAPRYGGPQDPADVVARAVPCALGGGTVMVPSPEDLGVLLALHGVKHAWDSLLWVVDFAAAVSRPGFDWALFASRAASWRVVRAVHFALLVAHEFVLIDPPAAVLHAARDDARAAYLARSVVARLTLAPYADLGGQSTARYDLRWLDGAWAQLRYLGLSVALPTPQERRLIRLPDVLLPLAYPVRAWRLLRRAGGWRA